METLRTLHGTCGPKRTLRYYGIKDTKYHCVVRFETAQKCSCNRGRYETQNRKLSEVSCGERNLCKSSDSAMMVSAAAAMEI